MVDPDNLWRARVVIQRERGRQEISQRELARRTGLDRWTVQRIEAGRREASPEEARALAKALRVRLVDLM